jgi:hypothetical protein
MKRKSRIFALKKTILVNKLHDDIYATIQDSLFRKKLSELTYKEVCDQLKSLYGKKVSVNRERETFFDMKQHDETVHAFLTGLQKQASTYAFNWSFLLWINLSPD